MDITVGCASLGAGSPLGPYMTSFGNIPHGTVYNLKHSEAYDANGSLKLNWTDPVMNQFKSMHTSIIAQLKAAGSTSATAGGAGTAGVAMIPIYVDTVIVDRTRKFTPLVEVFPRVTNLGTTADFNVITAKNPAAALPEDSPLSDQDTTRDRVSVAVKWIYAKGRVTGQAMAAYPAYNYMGFQPTGSGLSGSGFANVAGPNATQQEVIVRARALREEEERLIVNGNTTTDVNEFNGIVQTQSTTNKTDKNTEAMDYADIEDTVIAAFDDSGLPNFALSASSVLGDIRKLMINAYHYRPADMTTTLPFGVSSHLTLDTSIGPMPVIPSQQMSNTTGSKSIYFLDMNVWEMRVLQDMTYEELGKTNDSKAFMLKVYETMICRAPTFNSWIGEIA